MRTVFGTLVFLTTFMVLSSIIAIVLGKTIHSLVQQSYIDEAKDWQCTKLNAQHPYGEPDTCVVFTKKGFE